MDIAAGIRPGRASAPAAPSGHAAPSRHAAPPARDPILTTRIGLRFPPNLSYAGWERAGQHISRIIDSSAWCLGDWLVYGQEKYSDRYRRAVAAAGLDYQTLRNYAWVTRRFELSRRREDLSFHHHAEVAALQASEQERWLDRAEQFGWSRNQLRRVVREARRKAAGPEPRSALLPRVAVPAERVDSWRKAAERTDVDFGQWVVETLDRAAAHVLAQERLLLDDIIEVRR